MGRAITATAAEFHAGQLTGLLASDKDIVEKEYRLALHRSRAFEVGFRFGMRTYRKVMIKMAQEKRAALGKVA